MFSGRRGGLNSSWIGRGFEDSAAILKVRSESTRGGLYLLEEAARETQGAGSCSKVATYVRSKGKVSRNVLDPDYNDCHVRSVARRDPYSSYKSRCLLVISAMVPSTPRCCLDRTSLH